MCVSSSLNSKEKHYLVERFNKIAQFVALGRLDGFPCSSSMSVVQWNDDLESIAQIKANECDVNIKTCPNSPDDPYGFLLGEFRANSSHAIQGIRAIKTIITKWYEEHKNFDPRNVYKLESCSAPNFSQMIWDLGHFVGCGRVWSFDGDGFVVRLICALNMAGNILGQPIYAVGKPCSLCIPGLKCDEKFPGLCQSYIYFMSQIGAI